MEMAALVQARDEDMIDHNSGIGNGMKKDLGNISSDTYDVAISLQGQVFP